MRSFKDYFQFKWKGLKSMLSYHGFIRRHYSLITAAGSQIEVPLCPSNLLLGFCYCKCSSPPIAGAFANWHDPLHVQEVCTIHHQQITSTLGSPVHCLPPISQCNSTRSRFYFILFERISFLANVYESLSRKGCSRFREITGQLR